MRVRCCDFLAIEPLNAIIVCSLRDSQRQTTLAEIQALDDISVLTFLFKLILTYDADISDTCSDSLRNIVISQIKNLHREILGFHQQCSLS